MLTIANPVFGLDYNYLNTLSPGRATRTGLAIPAGDFRFALSYNQSVGVTTQLLIEFRNGSSLIHSVTLNVTGPGTYATAITLASICDNVRITGTPTVAGTGIFSITALTFDAITLITEQLELTVEDEPNCNPIYLQWKNSTGGDSFQVFQGNQEMTYNLSNGRRKRLTLFAENLTLAEYEAINELNNPSGVTKDNILEMLSSNSLDASPWTLKTHTQIGQQVYLVQPDGSKIGVIVIPTTNKTNTKNETHSIEINIDLPDVFY